MKINSPSEFRSDKECYISDDGTEVYVVTPGLFAGTVYVQTYHRGPVYLDVRKVKDPEYSEEVV